MLRRNLLNLHVVVYLFRDLPLVRACVCVCVCFHRVLKSPIVLKPKLSYNLAKEETAKNS